MLFRSAKVSPGWTGFRDGSSLPRGVWLLFSGYNRLLWERSQTAKVSPGWPGFRDGSSLPRGVWWVVGEHPNLLVQPLTANRFGVQMWQLVRCDPPPLQGCFFVHCCLSHAARPCLWPREFPDPVHRFLVGAERRLTRGPWARSYRTTVLWQGPLFDQDKVPTHQ